MKLIIGLGNIGEHFAQTRHNLGFMVLDNLVGSGEWLDKPKLKAEITQLNWEGQKLLLAKPTTYYNLSGEAVQAIKQFYKLQNSDILVVHDELALPFGTVRTRIGGTSAGNNGVKSLVAHVGEDFARIRIGIANDDLAHYDTPDFVLGTLTRQELITLPNVIDMTTSAIRRFCEGTFTHTTLK